MNRNKKFLLLLLFLAACAVVVYVSRFVGSPSFEEEKYRDTANLVVEEVTWEVASNGCLVSGVLVNRDTRSVLSIVLIAELKDETGTVIAANPMINVLNLPPMGRKTFEALIPAGNVPSEAEVTARTAVVCWLPTR